ncbi:Cyclin-dependent kinase 20 [Pelomyxa schiedti]|nr:Cyclin-dependent kinase 20 [Pelomyxa schiedti]
MRPETAECVPGHASNNNNEEQGEYTVLGVIGDGAYATVKKARRNADGMLCALKKVKCTTTAATTTTLVGSCSLNDGRGDQVPARCPRSLLQSNVAVHREITALMALRHPNIVKLYDTVAKPFSITVVLEFMPYDLDQVLKQWDVPEACAKYFLRLILRGLAYCHLHGVVHRDIKPSNILLDDTGRLVIADFGLARALPRCTIGGQEELMTNQVATRWYKAPELLLGAQRYDFGIDIWALGCVFVELLCGEPLFPGETDIDQLFKIVQILGTPTVQNWPGVQALPDFNKLVFSPLAATPFRDVIPRCSQGAIDLISKLLVYNPDSRLSAAQALVDPYFFTTPLPQEPPPLSGFIKAREPNSQYSMAQMLDILMAGKPAHFDNPDPYDLEKQEEGF